MFHKNESIQEHRVFIEETVGRAAWPVTEVVNGSEGVTWTGQTATGAICEEALKAVLTLQAGVSRQTLTLTGGLVTLVGIWNPLVPTAAVTQELWSEGSYSPGQGKGEAQEIIG